MTSVTYPTTWAWNGTSLVSTAGPMYTYSFDAMDRPTGLTDQSHNTDVSSVSYNAANQLLGITYFGKTESRTYNALNQMTNLTVGSTMNLTYTFPAGSNNGKISSQSDAISGETVTYQYDSLNRLLSASSNKGWSETYGFDGFGNLPSKTPAGGAPTLSQAVNSATNRIVGQNYDANGNQTSSSTGTLTYDAENRVLMAASAAIQYGYDSRNKRVWSATISGGSMTQQVSFYGVDGQKIGGYLLQVVAVNNAVAAVADSGGISVYFAGKRVGAATDTGGIGAFTQDRLGSNGSYYPYGEARGTVPQDQVGFATYTNDSATGLQYADQRYYASNFGRFMSPDPDQGSAGPANPTRQNRYPYGLDDPMNNTDPAGLDACDPLSFDFDPSLCLQDWTFAPLFPGFTLANPNFAIQFTDPQIADILSAYVGTFPSQLPDVAFGFLEAACDCTIPPLSKVDWSAIWDDIVTFLKSQSFGQLRTYKYRVTCYVHKIGTADHEAVGTVSIEVLAPDDKTAIAVAKPALTAMMQVTYGPTGYQLQHCHASPVG